MNILRRIFGLDKTFGSIRSPKWRQVRKEHLKRNPVCAVSGKRKKLEVHHIQPFHLRPDLELEPSNLITLNKKYHLIFGHLGSYYSYNPNVLEDAETWRDKISQRP